MWMRLRQMLIKEFIQVLRDKRARIVLIVPPILQMLIFGYAATLEIHHVPTAIVDYDNSAESRDLVSRFAASPYFDVKLRTLNPADVKRAIDRGDILLTMQVNAGFARNLRKGQDASIQAIVDASNSNTALVALGYVNQVAAKYSADYSANAIGRLSPFAADRIPSITVERRPWFNSDLSSQWFFVPGVIGNLLFIIVMVLTSFAVVREREIGTLEQIMVTPIRQAEFILGKTIPFLIIGAVEAVLITAVGTLWFRVPLRGSILVLAAGTLFYLLCVLGVGLLISTLASNQQQALVTAFFIIMPCIIFSGFASPIASMPHWLQILTYVDPLRYYLIILRSVYLKGTGFEILWPQMTALGALAVAILGLSIMRFRKSID